MVKTVYAGLLRGADCWSRYCFRSALSCVLLRFICLLSTGATMVSDMIVGTVLVLTVAAAEEELLLVLPLILLLLLLLGVAAQR